MDLLTRFWNSIKLDTAFWEEYADWLDNWLYGDDY
jgi:hypothetical protein